MSISATDGPSVVIAIYNSFNNTQKSSISGLVALANGITANNSINSTSYTNDSNHISAITTALGSPIYAATFTSVLGNDKLNTGAQYVSGAINEMVEDIATLSGNIGTVATVQIGTLGSFYSCVNTDSDHTLVATGAADIAGTLLSIKQCAAWANANAGTIIYYALDPAGPCTEHTTGELGSLCIYATDH